MPDQKSDAPSVSPDPDDVEEAGASGPYLAILLVALAIGAGLAVYIAGYRDEIVAILTQSPT